MVFIFCSSLAFLELFVDWESADKIARRGGSYVLLLVLTRVRDGPEGMLGSSDGRLKLFCNSR